MRTACHFSLLSLLALATACGANQPTNEEPPMQTSKTVDNTSAPTPVPAQRPTITAIVTHRVSDYATWKAAFDADAGARREAGIVGSHINRSVDDPNLLSVYLAATDAAKLDAFFHSDRLKETMSKAGVEGPPTITLMTPVEDKTVKSDPVYGMIVVHPVADFDAWKKVYDQLDDLRQKGGIIGAAVNRDANDPNRVIVFHQAKTLEALKAFAESPDLKAAMQRGGVAGPPTFQFVVGGGWAAN
jgi:quinol monooxygenase YgiN